MDIALEVLEKECQKINSYTFLDEHENLFKLLNKFSLDQLNKMIDSNLLNKKAIQKVYERVELLHKNGLDIVDKKKNATLNNKTIKINEIVSCLIKDGFVKNCNIKGAPFEKTFDNGARYRYFFKERNLVKCKLLIMSDKTTEWLNICSVPYSQIIVIDGKIKNINNIKRENKIQQEKKESLVS